MSRPSPFSPVGKRMRTMNEPDDTDESDDDQETSRSSDAEHPSQRSRKKSSLIGFMCDSSMAASTQDRRAALASGPLITDDEEDDDRAEEIDSHDESILTFADEDIDIDSDSGPDFAQHTEDEFYEDPDLEHPEYYGIDTDDYDSDAELTGYDTEDDSTIDQSSPEEYLKHDPTPNSQYPRPEWITVHELQQRRFGLTSSKFTNKSTNMYWFERYANNSLWMIQRLVQKQKLEEHSGPVNCLGFNSSGNLLCSGGEDQLVCIWDWQFGKLKKKINTGHHSNVFHSEFCIGDTNIITSSRDGTVRLTDIETGRAELILSQSGDIGKLAFLTPQTLVSCGTNAYVHFIDLRTKEPTKLFIVRNPRNNRSCALHSINAHPLDKHKIVVAGESPYVFLYDLRRVARNPHELEHKPTYCIDNNLESTCNIVTSTAFNSNGDKLLISYNDDDLFVCRTDTCKAIHRYTGHRNKKTIKGCSWFGDNFVLSGSDDGHIYGWDLDSEHIVCFLEGDIKGVVNCLCVHPTLPVLASSGLDSNVKVWEPLSKTWPQTLKGIKPQICKNTMRRKMAHGRSNRFQALRINVGDDTDDDPWFEGIVQANDM